MPKAPELQQLLYSREQVARLLGYRSIASIIRLERQGVLRPVRISRSPTGQVFYRAADIHQLVETATAE